MKKSSSLYLILIVVLGSVTITTVLADTFTSIDIQTNSPALRIGGFNQLSGAPTADVVTIGGYSGGGYDLLNIEDSNGGTLGNGISRLVVKAGGDVGIGTSSPIEKLDVAGSIRLTGNLVSPNDICIGTC